ncbi:MAG: hypothetical protein JSR91_05930 [Proteobacteria bacterium]|nr:hypothetical protein [Pseudomonadota bacterium]
MRIVNKLSIGAALFGSVILAFAGAAQAHDDWDPGRWDYGHDRGWHHGHERVVERRFVEERLVYVPRPVVIERPVVVERPVMMAAPPIVYAPPPIYSTPGPARLTLNFNIPLQ